MRISISSKKKVYKNAWENDPYLTKNSRRDKAVEEERFQTYKDLGLKPKDIKDKALAKLYAKWLEE